MPRTHPSIIEANKKIRNKPRDGMFSYPPLSGKEMPPTKDPWWRDACKPLFEFLVGDPIGRSWDDIDNWTTLAQTTEVLTRNLICWLEEKKLADFSHETKRWIATKKIFRVVPPKDPSLTRSVTEKHYHIRKWQKHNSPLS
jgi:hypothetical protein